MKYLIAQWAWDAGMQLLQFSQRIHGKRIRFMTVTTDAAGSARLTSRRVPCE